MMHTVGLKCPKCNSHKLSKSGKRWIGGEQKQQYLCGNCGHRTVNPIAGKEIVK